MASARTIVRRNIDTLRDAVQSHCTAALMALDAIERNIDEAVDEAVIVATGTRTPQPSDIARALSKPVLVEREPVEVEPVDPEVLPGITLSHVRQNPDQYPTVPDHVKR